MTLFNKISNIWDNFWYEWNYPEIIHYGGGPQGWKVFRKQRLFNVITSIIVISLIIYVILN